MNTDIRQQMTSLHKGQVVKVTTEAIRSGRQITRYGEVVNVIDMGSLVTLQCWQMAQTKEYGRVRTMRSFIVTSGRTVALEQVA